MVLINKRAISALVSLITNAIRSADRRDIKGSGNKAFNFKLLQAIILIITGVKYRR